MIAYIKGQLAEVNTDSIVVEHHGLGYQIFVPTSVLDQVPMVGDDIKVYTYLYVREDLMCLYGFMSKDDLNIFKLLISVSGIGPKGALGILSAISPDNLRFAVLAGDAKTISKAPGIGAKTAQRLIIELKDKLKLEDMLEPSDNSAGTNAPIVSDSKNEAVLALVALGYSQAESLAAIRKCAITEDMSSDMILKLALKKMI